MNTICNKCGADFRLDNETIKYKWSGEIQASFIECPDCKAKFPISVTDAALRNEIDNTRLQADFDDGFSSMIVERMRENKARGDALIAEHWERILKEVESE